VDPPHLSVLRVVDLAPWLPGNAATAPYQLIRLKRSATNWNAPWAEVPAVANESQRLPNRDVDSSWSHKLVILRINNIRY